MPGTERPSRGETLMAVAYLWAKRSTCDRLHVGAVFAREGRILVNGYNGAPAGLPHCDHTCDCEDWPHKPYPKSVSPHHPDCRSIRPCTIAEHAERNGIAYAARYGIALEGCEVFVTHMPCIACAMSLINAGVLRVTYQETYRDDSGIRLLRAAGLFVDQYTEG